MFAYRCRTRLHPDSLRQMLGKIVEPSAYSMLLTGPARVLKPDGSLLCVYLPRALDLDLLEESYATLHELRQFETGNRGLASGMPRNRTSPGGRNRTTYSVPSAIIGSMDPSGQTRYCRLTAWTGQEWDKYRGLFPLFQAIASNFAQHVPDRHAIQAEHASRTNPAWVIPGTPFTTITVNNSFPTGVHTDKGDLGEGFSTIAVLRRGHYEGCHLVFPEYGVAADLQNGGQILMDAHEWHGNTHMVELTPDAERISVVAYFRTNVASCGSPAAELERARTGAEARNAREAAETAAPVE